MKIGRKKIYRINLISRLGIHSCIERKKMYKLSQILVNRIAKTLNLRLLLDDTKIYARRDDGVDTMLLYFKESEGGCIVLKLNLGDKNAHVLFYSKAENCISSNNKAFSRSHVEFAKNYLHSPDRDSIVYRLSDPRPLGNLEELVRIAEESKTSIRAGEFLYLHPNQENTFFSPEKILRSAEINFKIVNDKFMKNSHVICVPNRFPGWSKYINLVHSAYGANNKKDITKILVTLELEKRIWAEQEEGISRFLTLARDHIGSSLTVLFNGMTATANGKRFSRFDEIDLGEKKIIDQIRRNSPKDTRFFRSFGMTIDEKIEQARTYGFYVGPFGSSSVISTVMNIPGVTYQNQHYIKLTRKAPKIKYCIKIPANKIKNIPDKEGIAANEIEHYGGKKQPQKSLVGYSISPNEFSRIAFRQYKKISNLSH